MVELHNKTKVIPHHIAALDGLRAFAIIAVIIHHCGEYYLIRNSPTTSFFYGFIENLGSGVDLFFALSGFLITGILLDSLERPYYFARFYWRRGLRIWPLYYVFLLAVWLVHRRVFSGLGIAPFAFYYRNFLGPDRTSDVYIGQFWSLCVEEQFYLIWPFVIYFLPKRLRMPTIVGLICAALFLRAYFMWRGMDPYVIYRLPFCHMDVLLAGAAVAVLIRWNINKVILKKLFGIAIIAGAVCLSLVWIRPQDLDSMSFPLELTGTSMLFGGVVGLCAKNYGRITAATLGSPFLRAISTRSYAMYVFHLVPLYASVALLTRFHSMPPNVSAALFLILVIGLATYGMAWLSWRYLEEPVLRLKKWEWFANQRTSPSDYSST